MFVLSGEDLSLPLAETRALIQTYSDESADQTANRRVVLSKLSDVTAIEKIAERGAYCRFGGILIAKSEKLDEISKNLDTSALKLLDENGTFAVDSYSVDRDACGELGRKIKFVTKIRVDLENPSLVFQLEKIGSAYALGLSSAGFKSFAWKTRRPRARRFFLPSAIYPKLARVLVNLSHVKEGEIFLDPFCGTGSLLIESSLMGIWSIGIDLKRWIAKGALMNLKAFHLENGVLRSDSSHSHLPLRRIDAISTDVPYGRASSTLGKTTRQIMDQFLEAAGDILSPNRCLVVMHPAAVPFSEDNKSFDMIEEHFVYVHRSLTRAISVLKRRE